MSVMTATRPTARTASQTPAARRSAAESVLREVAYVLHLTRRLGDEIRASAARTSPAAPVAVLA